MSAIEILESERSEITEKIDQLRSIHKINENGGRVGKFFKVRNNYSMPKSESDYWWLYFKVLSIDEFGSLQTVQFQVDKYGKIEIEKMTVNSIQRHYVEIEVNEYAKAWAKMMDDILKASS